MKKFNKQELRKKVIQGLECGTLATDADVYREIDRVILSEGHHCYETLLEKGNLRKQLFNSIRRYDLLEKYLEDESVTEIMVIGATKIFIEQNGRIRKTEDSFFSEEEVYRLIDQIVSPTNRMVNESSPIVDGRLSDGSRVHVVLPPVSLEGPVITIRKFQKGGMTIKNLIDFEEFSFQIAKVLSCLVKGRYSILISGATNSGKSSLLNALSEYILPDERIITIEDSSELKLFHVDNLVRLETRNANMEGRNQVTMNDLIKASLRMRPDRIIVGEVRGEEAISMLQAVSTGHNGSFSSIHANSCRDALRRLETMVLMGIDMPLRAVQGLIASSINILIHIGRLQSGKRKIFEISEVTGFDGADYQINPLFRYNVDSMETQELEMVYLLSQIDRMKSYGQYEAYCEAMEFFDDKEKE